VRGFEWSVNANEDNGHAKRQCHLDVWPHMNALDVRVVHDHAFAIQQKSLGCDLVSISYVPAQAYTRLGGMWIDRYKHAPGKVLSRPALPRGHLPGT